MTERTEIINTEIQAADGLCYEAQICYEIDEWLRTIGACTVIFKVKPPQETDKDIRESVRVLINDAEPGHLKYKCEILIQ